MRVVGRVAHVVHSVTSCCLIHHDLFILQSTVFRLPDEEAQVQISQVQTKPHQEDGQ